MEYLEYLYAVDSLAYEYIAEITNSKIDSSLSDLSVYIDSITLDQTKGVYLDSATIDYIEAIVRDNEYIRILKNRQN